LPRALPRHRAFNPQSELRTPQAGGLPAFIPSLAVRRRTTVHSIRNPQSELRNRLVRPPYHSGPYRIALRE
jgi:hypothetical protein